MLNAIQKYTTSILFTCISVLAFATLVVLSIYLHKAWTNYHFHLTDFKKFDSELRLHSSELTQMRQDVELDHSALTPTKIRNAELLAAADDVDNGLRIALAAWEDIMDPFDEEGKGRKGLDIESKGDKMLKGRRRSHGRWVIRLMKGKCVEGFERRGRMEKELQSMYNEVISRKMDLQSNLFNRRVASGYEIKAERSVLQPDHRQQPEQMQRRGSLHVLPRVEMPLDSSSAVSDSSSSSLPSPSGSPERRSSSCPVREIDNRLKC